MRYLKCLTISFLLIFFLSASIVTQAQTKLQKFKATAYCGSREKNCPYSGKTASGVQVRKGIIATDKNVIPLGSIVEIVEPKEYAGRYISLDTGSAIRGNIVDIYLHTFAEARRLGRRSILLQIVGFVDPKLILKNKISLNSILYSCADFISHELVAESRDN